MTIQDPTTEIMQQNAMKDVFADIQQPPVAFTGDAAAQLPDLAGYHMVAAITQDTINYQFKLLHKDEVIQPTLKLELEDTGITIEATLGPPTVKLGTTADRRTVIFVLSMPRGKFSYYEGFGPKAKKQTVDFRDWRYAFRVNMDMRQVQKKALSEGRGVPAEVKKHLENVTDEIFTIRQLFMDFQSADLADFDPSLSRIVMPDDKPATVGTLGQLAQLLKMYFSSLKGTDNPYILGYSIARKPEVNEGEPALFAPTAATFSSFQDQNEKLSTLNYLLMTRRAPLPESPLAGLFHSNWVTSPTYDGVMAVAESQFQRQYIEGLILPAIRGALGTMAEFTHVTSAEDLKQRLRIDEQRYQRSFGDVVKGPGWALYSYRDNMNEDDGHGHVGFGTVVADQVKPMLYLERRQATSFFLRLVPGPEIVLEGLGFTWLTHDYCNYPLNLRAWQGGFDVSLAFNVRAELVAGKNGRLTIRSRFSDNVPTTWSDISFFNKLPDFILSWFTKSFHQSLEEHAKHIAGMQKQFVEGVERQLREGFEKLSVPLILPAGDVFYFKNARFDASRNVLLDISYKAES